MKDLIKNKKHLYIIAIVTLAYTLIMSVCDKNIFIFPDSSSSGYAPAVFDYTISKILAFVAFFALAYCVYRMVRKDRKSFVLYNVILSALPYLVVIVAVSAVKLPGGYLSNDEYSIYNDAVNLTHSTWFNVLTPYFYTVSLMLLPIKYAPIIMKLVIEYLVVGYVTLRSREYFGNRIGSISYVLFLLYPVIAYTTSAHRLPIYFLLYLLLFSKMIFDRLTGVALTKLSAVWMFLLGAVLTQWRTEGIYLVILLPILILIAYPESFVSGLKKRVIIYFAIYFIFQALVSYPQNAFSGADLGDAANDRMKPFYAYTITNMYRNGLDFEKNSDDLEIVDKYMSLDMIKAINEHYEDINYEDVLILYQEGFVGVREEATVEDFINYSDALKRLFLNNKDVFIKTRIGAFCYAALPFHIETNAGIKSLGVSVVKSVAYNLFIPMIIVTILLVYSLIKKRWFDFFVAGGLLAHWFIVFILAPASYFKYYFPVYIMAYFYLIMMIMKLVVRIVDKKNEKKTE